MAAGNSEACWQLLMLQHVDMVLHMTTPDQLCSGMVLHETSPHLAPRGGGGPQAVGEVHAVGGQRLAGLDADERGVVEPQEQLAQRRRGEGARTRRLGG